MAQYQPRQSRPVREVLDDLQGQLTALARRTPSWRIMVMSICCDLLLVCVLGVNLWGRWAQPFQDHGAVERSGFTLRGGEMQHFRMMPEPPPVWWAPRGEMPISAEGPSIPLQEKIIDQDTGAVLWENPALGESCAASSAAPPAPF